jgi:amino acid transporter
MRTRPRTLIVQLIWGIGGLAAGSALALMWFHNFTPEWVEATGTWFGAIATVLALLWAVQTFRSDQAAREEARKREERSEFEHSRMPRTL